MAKSLQRPAEATESGRRFVDSYLLYLLAAASDKASAQFHQQVQKKGLRVPEWRVLAILVDRDGAMITHLAELALIEQSRLTRIVAQMDERGYVSRQSDASDGRRVRVHLTAKGKRVAKSLVAEAQTHELSLVRTLADTDAEHLKSALTVLLRHLQAEQQE